MTTLTPAERIVLAIDTSNKKEASALANLAASQGARFIKLGLGLSSATSWQWCSELAAKHGLYWIADAKVHDIPNTSAATVSNLASLHHRPFGITVHLSGGKEVIEAVQAAAGGVILFGVSILTSLSAEEAQKIYGESLDKKVLELALVGKKAGFGGLVVSAREVGMIKRDRQLKDMITLVPGTRSAEINNNDQARIASPAEAAQDGADLLVIGRQIANAKSQATAFKKLVGEIERALN